MARPNPKPALATLALAAAVLTSGSPVALAIDRVSVTIDRIETAGITLRKAKADLRLDPRTASPSATLDVGFAGGDLKLSASLTDRRWNVDATATSIAANELVDVLRPSLGLPGDLAVQGRIDASLTITGRADAASPSALGIDIRGADLGASNAEGSIAAEGVDLAVRLQLRATDDRAFALTSTVDAGSGDLLFGNAYLQLEEFPTRIDVSGTLIDNRLEIDSLDGLQRGLARLHARARLSQATNFDTSLLDLATLRIDSAMLELSEVDVPAAYKSYLRTALGGTALDSLESSGRLSGRLEILDSRPSNAHLELEGVSLRDSKGLFFIDGLDGQIRWTLRDDTPVEPSVLSWDAAGLYEARGSGSTLRLALRGSTAELLEPARLPVFDGALKVQRLLLSNPGSPSMQLQFTGEVEPISLGEISRAFGWPALGGIVTGRIPSVEYRDDTLSFGGDLEAEIFDGRIRGSNIKLIDPFGRWPRMTADLVLQDIDLELLTSAFEFGSITGRLEGRIDDLELFDWMPTSFDASLRTPLGDRSRKRISVAAINSLSTIGGTAGVGVATALQSGMLRFFSRYRYRQLAIRCILKDDICDLSGAPIDEIRFYLLEGAGIPRVDIIGNSGRLQWSKLLQQIAWQIETGGTFRIE